MMGVVAGRGVLVNDGSSGRKGRVSDRQRFYSK